MSVTTVELRGIRKEFPGVVALDGVNLTLKGGSVHGLIGENGAGKSTLMKILSGTYASYEGEILLDGNRVQFRNEKDALNHGISIVAQELNPIPELSIAENIFLGREVRCNGVFISKKDMVQEAQKLLESIHLNLDAHVKMNQLSVAQKQLVEIAKAISRNSRVIIMDEPTSALTSRETEYLFTQIEELKKKGIAIVFISHKLDEVFRVCDEISVLRDGKFIGSKKIDEVDENQLITMMVGREIKDIYPSPYPASDELVMEVKDLCRDGVFEHISFQLHKGEILGFAGMMGAGRSEIMRCIFGLDRYDSGEIWLEGKPLRIRSTQSAIREGIAMVTEDRATYGFVGVRSITDNIALPNGDKFTRFGWTQQKTLDQSVKTICERLHVRAASPKVPVSTLSGGNQQKVVLSKWLVRNVKVLIMDEPTRGIDVGAKQEIYKFITELAHNGMAVILISSEMPEVLSMSHRIQIVADGRIVGQGRQGELDQNGIMKAIIEGGKHNA